MSSEICSTNRVLVANCPSLDIFVLQILYLESFDVCIYILLINSNS